ncbi:MAG: hypothetical protein JKY12_09530, partial [Sneathiella sp.]|nr:hypothetical protein [Sneathiella sp.]
SAGLYSTDPAPAAFAPKDPAIYQAEINADKGATVSQTPTGRAHIETYTIMHDRNGPTFGLLFGRLEDGSRFIANPPKDPSLLSEMTKTDYLNASGKVAQVDGLNVFTPD